MTRPTRIYFLHVKKCAGTSLVRLAAQQPQIRLPKLQANAIPLKSADPVSPQDPTQKVPRSHQSNWLRFWDLTVAEQQALIERENWGFFANEDRITESFERIPGLFYLTNMRDPVDRWISHVRHGHRIRTRRAEETGSPLPPPLTGQQIIDGMPNHNFMTMVFAGRKVTGHDPDALEIAKRNLAQFDFVVFQDSYDQDMRALADRLGWTLPQDKALPRFQSAPDSEARTEDLVGAEARAEMGRLGATDRALYDWAKEHMRVA